VTDRNVTLYIRYSSVNSKHNAEVWIVVLFCLSKYVVYMGELYYYVKFSLNVADELMAFLISGPS
jgi:hypothetical protein